jgi:hypothetical protein
MDTKENEEILSVFSSFMYNRKYKIHCVDKEIPTKPKNVSSLKDYKFYNRRLLNFYKTLLITKQCQSTNSETNEYINNIPNDLIELGNKFIEESILFFKREDRNEIIQKDLFEKENENDKDDDNSLEPLENTNEIDMKFYQSSNNPISNGTFQIIEDKDETNKNSIPQQRQYNLRDNSFRLKGITKNNNMSILYEPDEKKDP